MGKVLDWNQIADVDFDARRRKKHGQMTGRELFAKAHAQLQHAEDIKAQRAAVEPILKNALVKAILNKTPIKVLAPIQNPTEALGGITKSDDDDGFYNSSPSASVEAASKATFQEVMETIPAGTDLVFKSWDKQLSQWIFKGSNGQEYAIYTDGVVMFNDSSIENPGLYGLLYNTSLTESLGDE